MFLVEGTIRAVVPWIDRSTLFSADGFGIREQNAERRSLYPTGYLLNRQSFSQGYRQKKIKKNLRMSKHTPK